MVIANAYAADNNPLHDAVHRGDRSKVAALLAKGADVNAKDTDGATALHVAASLAYPDIVELLLTKGANVNAKDKDGNTPLYWAQFSGVKEISELLLAKGADVNAKNAHGETPLDWAQYSGKKDIADLLLAKGAEVNAKDKDGRTPTVANIADLSRSTYKPIWERNIERANELSEQAEQLAKAGNKLDSWRAMSEAVQLSPGDPLLLRDFCHPSFDVGRYRDVVWSARKLKEENGWLMSAAAESEWGISLAALAEYEQAAQILKERLKKNPNDDWADFFREWSIVLTYLNKDFPAAFEEARAHPVQALGDSTVQDPVFRNAVWDLLAKHIGELAGMADDAKMQYPLLNHLSQLHRLLREGLEGEGGRHGGDVSFQTPEWKAKVGEISRDLAWRTISIYRSLPIKPLPPLGAVEKERRALNVFATEPWGNGALVQFVNWNSAIKDLVDVTRRVPWWAEAHYNVAVLFENRGFGNNWGPYYDYGALVPYGGALDRTIAAQEYMFCVGADPHGSKADAARKMLQKWKQPIPK